MQDDELTKGLDRDVPPYVDRNVADAAAANAIREGDKNPYFRFALGNVRRNRKTLEQIAADSTNAASSGARDKLAALTAYENRNFLTRLLNMFRRK